MSYQKRKGRVSTLSLSLLIGVLMIYPRSIYSKTTSTSSSTIRISVPEYRYKAYKNCEAAHSRMLEELLETRIDLSNARSTHTGTTWLDGIGLMLIGAGIYGLVKK